MPTYSMIREICERMVEEDLAVCTFRRLCIERRKVPECTQWKASFMGESVLVASFDGRLDNVVHKIGNLVEGTL